MPESVLGHDAVRTIGSRLRARHDELVDAMTERLVDGLPTPRRGGRDDAARLAAAITEGLAHAFASGDPVRPQDLLVVAEQANRQVHQGVALDALLSALRAALSHFWDVCLEEAERLDLPLAATVTRVALEAVDTVTTCAAEAYVREEARFRDERREAAGDLVDRLLAGQLEAAARHPAASGLDATGEFTVVVARVQATAPTAVEGLRRTRDALEATVASGGTHPLAAIRHGELVMVAPDSYQRIARRVRTADRRVTSEFGIDVRYGISAASAGFANVPRAYREALATLSYTTPIRPIVSIDELSALECALLGADARGRALIAAKGGRLDGDPGMIEETVRAYADAGMNVARAARQLEMHVNSTNYRLGRIAEITGHDPRTFAGLLELLCILEARRLEGL